MLMHGVAILHALDIHAVCTVGGAVDNSVMLIYWSSCTLLRSPLFVITGGGLDKIVVLMEGESLFNDATSIVLFEIFFEMVKKLGSGGPGTEGGLFQEGLNIVVQISWLAAGPSSSILTEKSLGECKLRIVLCSVYHKKFQVGTDIGSLVWDLNLDNC